jgi:hypothetical protein
LLDCRSGPLLPCLTRLCLGGCGRLCIGCAAQCGCLTQCHR